MRCLTRFLGHGDGGCIAHTANGNTGTGAEQNRLIGLPANGSGDLVGQIGRQSIGVVQQLIGHWHKCHELFETQGRQTENGFGVHRRGGFTLPIGSDTVASPWRGFILGEGHGVASDLHVVSQRQERILAQRQLEDFLRELRWHQKATILRRAFTAKARRRCCITRRTDQQAIINRGARVLRLTHCLEKLANAFKAMLGIRSSVLHHSDNGSIGQMSRMHHVRLFGDQCSFTINGGRGCLNLGFQGFKSTDFFFVHITLLSGSDVGQGTCVLDQS